MIVGYLIYGIPKHLYKSQIIYYDELLIKNFSNDQTNLKEHWLVKKYYAL